MLKPLLLVAGISSVFAASAQNVQRNGLAEEFSASTCHPCKDLYDQYHPALVSINANDTSAHVNAISYQMDYPGTGDASYNLHAQQRHDYNLVLGLPTLRINGQGINTSSTQAQLYTALDTSRNKPAHMKITGSYEVNLSAQTLDINVSVLPLTNLTGKYRVHVAVVERHYTNPANTVNMPDYYFVMRRMFPDGKGKAEYSWSANTAKTYHYNQAFSINNPPAQGSFDFWGNPLMSDVIVFVQDSVTREILQSQLILPRSPLSVHETDFAQQVLCYPNPADNYLYFSFSNSKPIVCALQMTDASGRLMYQVEEHSFAAGVHQYAIPTGGFPKGLYFITLSSEQGRMTRKVVIDR